MRWGSAFVVTLAMFSTSLNQSVSGEQLDFRAWQALPVLDGGRIMPLDTFAENVVDTICDRTYLKIWLKDAVGKETYDASYMAGARELFPDIPGHKGVKLQAPELLLSWLIEPEKWEQVPFLIAEHEELRELLGLPIVSETGAHLKYAAPADVDESQELRDRMNKMRMAQQKARAKNEEYHPGGAEKKITELITAYNTYRSLTFNPLSPDSPKGRFGSKLQAAAKAWQRVSQGLQTLGGIGTENELHSLVTKVDNSLQELIPLVTDQHSRFDVREVEPTVVELQQAINRLAEHFAAKRRQLSKAVGFKGDQLASAQATLTFLDTSAREARKQINELHLALYDDGEGLRVVPALNVAALEKGRDQSDDAQPWLSLQAVLLGSDDLLKDYPQKPLKAVRKNFQAVAAAYVNRQASDRAAHFKDALEKFAQSMRVLGTGIEPLREKLPIRQSDERLLAYTAYPPPGAVDAELRYNRIDPFGRGWMISFTALLLFSLSFGVVRKPFFWLGMTVLFAGLVWTAFGFYLRIAVTGWAPVTNMYETVVYVPFFVTVLATWLALLPLSWPAITNAWRLTAAPGTWEASPLTSAQQSLFGEETWKISNYLLLIPRIALMGCVFWILTQAPYAAGERTIINLSPTAGGVVKLSGNSLLTWSAGMFVLIPAVWYLPRLLLSLALALPLTYPSLRGRFGVVMDEIVQRKPFLLAGTFVAFLGTFVAWYSPVLNESIGPLQPVLRDNFWLTIHVLTIVSSYGAGALAWGLGNLALGYYLFGNYREPVVAGIPTGHLSEDNIHPDSSQTGNSQTGDSHIGNHGEKLIPGKRPPKECATLANFNYKSQQVAVLLLAAGTILGGLWADVSWGRFWGWDPKEVWALISLLTYLAILHGRFAGWFGNFGLAVGAVLGASAIVFSWYGVNFVLGAGLHSYGFGAGGQMEVGSAVAANWLFLILAGIRYRTQTAPIVVPNPVKESVAEIAEPVDQQEASVE